MFLIFVILIIGATVSLWLFRFYLFSFLTYLSARFGRRGKDFQLLSSLRENLIHERKKKMAGLEMILSSWEKGDEIQPRYEYFEELLDQLKDLIQEEKKNLMAVTEDIFLWGKLWSMLRHVERISREKKERVEIRELRKELSQIQKLIDQVIEGATEQFSFTLNQVVAEAVKIVRVEKSHLTGIEIQEHLDDVGNTIRFSYAKFKEWQRILTNLIRNAVDAVETKKSGDRDLGLVAGEKNYWVTISTKQTEPVSNSVSVFIEDSGIGMDESTKSSFYKKGFTSGKSGGLGLGISEESVQFINQYGNWEIESQRGVGTKITIKIDREKAQKAELILPAPKPFLRTKLAFGVSLFLLALIALALFFAFDKYSRFWVDWNPAYAKLMNENTVLVETKDGGVLWDRKFPQKIFESGLTVGDVVGDGKNEVIIGTQSGFKETGYIYCFSFDGKELWRLALGAKGVFGIPSDKYGAGKILIRDLDLDGEKEIAVAGINYPYFPCQIAVLNKHGQLQTSYWHSGNIDLLFCDDIDGDSIPELVCGGVNNRLQYSAVLIVLNYEGMQGQSPPYIDTVLPKAQEKIYIKFPFVKGLGGRNQMFSFVKEFIYTGKENGSDVYRADVHDHRGFLREFYLNNDLTNVIEINVIPDSRFLWQKLKEEDLLKYDLTPEVIESWKKIEVWKNGKKVK